VSGLVLGRDVANKGDYIFGSVVNEKGRERGGCEIRDERKMPALSMQEPEEFYTRILRAVRGLEDDLPNTLIDEAALTFSVSSMGSFTDPAIAGVILSGRVSINSPSPVRPRKFRRRPSVLPLRALASPR
jgi:hypothetical protein